MNDFELELNKVRELLMNEPVVKEFFTLKKEIDNNSEIQLIKQNIKEKQRLMRENASDVSLYTKLKKEADSLNIELQNNPLVSNYYLIKDEIYNLLDQIKQIIN